MKIKIDPLDILFSRLVRTLANGKCEFCGNPKEMGKLQCSHYHGRRKKSVRWDLENACGICFSCHQHFGENPYVHTEWFKKRLGSERFEQLNIRAETTHPKPDKEAIKEYLEKRLGIEEDD